MLSPSRLEVTVSSPPLASPSPPPMFIQGVASELRKQRDLSIPLIAMNLTWFAKMAITTVFLGHLGPTQLAGGTLGFTFANVTGFSVLNGLCGAMEPICGQAYGAKNFKLLHKTLLMAILLLLFATVPISFLWLNVDKILVHFGQQRDLVAICKTFLFFLLPHLVVTSLFCPLRSYLNSQGITLPTFLGSAFAAAVHVPLNIFLSRTKGVQGVAMAVWLSDLIVVLILLIFVFVMEPRKGERCKEGGWWDQGFDEWVTLLWLAGPCCLTTCLEWWCYEILVLLTGRLANARESVGVLAIVLNFDYMLFAIMLSLSITVSTRISNELGSNHPYVARHSAYVTLVVAFVSGCGGAAAMVESSGWWGGLFSHDKSVIRRVKKMMKVMALIEVANFPLAVVGGIIRGTARPWFGTYANLGAFYVLALPLGSVLAFKARIGLEGLLLGFLAGVMACLALMLVFIARIDWVEEARKAQARASCMGLIVSEVAENQRSRKNDQRVIHTI